MVIYVEVLQNNIPVFDSYGNTPLMLIYFIVTIITICVCLLVSTHTLFLYHVNSYESINFSKTEARISRILAKIFNFLCFGLWEIETPAWMSHFTYFVCVLTFIILLIMWYLISDYVIRISKHPTDDLHREFDHEMLKHGFQFFADMINRTVFIVVICVQAQGCKTKLPMSILKP